MLKILLKKQLTEAFKGYFYDAKKNRMRSRGAIIGWFVFYAFMMVFIFGGMFTSLAVSFCGPLAEAGTLWLYFVIMGGLAILFGAFGSVFTTYSGLYLAKDNDLILSMPIPVNTVIAARLINVYLIGTMYVCTVLIPTLAVCWITDGITAARVVCGILFLLLITVTVLLLSCLLGWVVAKISLRLKNKSFISVIIALAFIGVYYFFYFKANDLIREIILNARKYGENIRGSAYVLYLFGRAGEGDMAAAAIFLAVTAVFFVLVWLLLSRSFLDIATSAPNLKKARLRERRIKAKTPFGALTGKELARFTSSANYMLNCGLGLILLPAGGILMLIKGRDFCAAINDALGGRPDSAAVLICAAICLITSMIDICVPSVSLEGNSLWLLKSLPVLPKTVLRAKAFTQIKIMIIPTLFAAVCASVIVDSSAAVKLLVCVLPPVFSVFTAMSGMALGIKMPILNWNSEIVPIKQSGAVAVALFGGWGVSAVPAIAYLLIGYKIGAVFHLLLFTVVFAAAAAVLLRWLDKKGGSLFADL